MPRTVLQMTDEGRAALRAYRDQLIGVLSQLPD
jgi:hypothetical protein